MEAHGGALFYIRIFYNVFTFLSVDGYPGSSLSQTVLQWTSVCSHSPEQEFLQVSDASRISGQKRRAFFTVLGIFIRSPKWSPWFTPPPQCLSAPDPPHP